MIKHVLLLLGILLTWLECVSRCHALTVRFTGNMQFDSVYSTTDSLASPQVYVFRPDAITTSGSVGQHYILSKVACKDVATGAQLPTGLGYQLSITFLDTNMKVLAGLSGSYNASMKTGVAKQWMSFPSIGEVRIRTALLQSTGDIEIVLDAVAFLSGANMGAQFVNTAQTTFTTTTITGTGLAVPWSFSCTPTIDSRSTFIHVRIIGKTPGKSFDEMFDPDVVTVRGSAIPQVLPSAAFTTLGVDSNNYPDGYLDLFGLGTNIDLIPGSASPLATDNTDYIEVAYRCMQVARPIASASPRDTASVDLSVQSSSFADLNSPSLLEPPFLLLSDVDGAAQTHSFLPQMEMQGVQEVSLFESLASRDPCAASTSIVSGDSFLQVSLLRAVMMPSMNDPSWGSPGYRSALTLLSRSGAPLSSFGGDTPSVTGYQLALPTLGGIRLRLWSGASAAGYAVLVECASKSAINSNAFANTVVNHTYYASTAIGGANLSITLQTSVWTSVQCPAVDIANGAQIQAWIPTSVVVGRDIIITQSQLSNVFPTPAYTTNSLYYKSVFSFDGTLQLRGAIAAGLIPPIDTRCVFVYGVSGSSLRGITNPNTDAATATTSSGFGTRQVISLPAMIYSDLDFASSGSWASYPDMGTDTLWEINDASSSACATSTSAPHLRRLDAWMQGNMHDGSWGSPGYRTIFSFLDDDGRLIASFGNIAQMSIEDISLPGLKYIRFRQWGGNSGPGFLIDLYCKSVSVLVFNSLLSTFTSVATTQVSNALTTSFTCADDPSAQILLTFTNVSQYQQGTAALGALVQDIRSRLVGATLVYDTSSGSFLSAGQPATAVSGIPSPGGAPVSQVIFSESTSSPFTSLEITHRCVYLHRPCAVEATSSLLGSQRAATSSCATNNNRQPLKLPALFLSDEKKNQAAPP
ncbi:Hypothetical protein, putative [Bodo saltans]|uniref:Membrane-associated protein n=1 Tax=Bodo saltans TaxID=75058 RepID=A0A0S4J035_BODSA|nr:Hypothetical protein, putative [Bodo saltans]|eukprot:CUG72117.1 Hypothetical protein, putative [Bodo saltans]